MLDDYAKAELRRSALGYVQRDSAHDDVPARIRELRLNIDRLEGRDGRSAETREQNEFELDQLQKLAVALDIPTDVENEQPQAEEDE